MMVFHIKNVKCLKNDGISHKKSEIFKNDGISYKKKHYISNEGFAVLRL